ncbi:Stp1/IreP family PP2C-type Ser/Thr phosphatase [Niallia endozanthoxylica]|uniref:Stp1/IreP family PP2C-type Ser/Thr phosphatase n=1 Tax=Niallia endozanthoxylica TaxID=2036016 RepID=A0A5J5HSQ8_9BACI|nr:Stp1/IreP family PP2C-type Ser/Thr phosphatase [Niallia endozanthoxylica]KAA9023916.1 Stp1/IreP family PP2C-type Ser/Thr phosphatase [Niallia endozanthoxylica]
MYEIYGLTDVGCVREHNEDGFLIQKARKNQGELHLENVEGTWIAAVADGMGGQAAGEVASELALKHLEKLELPISSEELMSYLNQINDEILAYGSKNKEAKGLGTTLTGMICNDHQLTLFHIGDSRLYRFRDGFLKQISQDHSLVEALFQQGEISREEKSRHPKRHILLRSLGTTTNGVKADVESVRGRFESGDLFLLCSDGLNDSLTDEEIERVLGQDQSLENTAHALIQSAKQAGGEDNITVVMVRRHP